MVSPWNKIRQGVRYEISPEYDPAIRTKDPDLAESPDAWRPKEGRRTERPKGDRPGALLADRELRV